MRVHAAVLGFIASPALAAYLQWQYCDGHNDNPQLLLEGLNAHLQRRDSGTRINLRLQELTTRENCDSLLSEVEAGLHISLLGGSTTSSVVAATTCSAPHKSHGDNNSAILDIAISTDTDILYSVSTFHLDLRLSRGKLVDEIECVSANITPELTPMVKMVLQLILAVTFILVLFIGCLQTLFDKPDSLAEGYEDSLRPSRQSVLPGVSDCLYHLQFVFLTGALSLRYPGFYQPVVSHLNWFSLLNNSNTLTKGVTYPSINDGIYEINGTYGGTHGLELMTQIAGAPMTMELWVDMVILITLISVAIAVLLEVNVFLNRNRESERQPAQDEQQSRTGLRGLINQVLRLVLSYFLLPLITLSAYQIDRANILPGYHTALAVGLIVVIILAFFWLVSQIPVRNLGAFISYHSKAYQLVPTASLRENSFVLSFFVLTFIRAIAIGGLQIVPIAQIIVLILTEIICIVCIISFNPDSINSIATACAASRLVTLIFMITFLPGVAGLSTKSIIGYILLFQQVIVLVFAILLPSIFGLIRLCLVARRVEDIPVYNVRQLRRRQTRNSINDGQEAESVSRSDHAERLSYTASMSSISMPHGLETNRSSVSSRYYRLPRSSSHRTGSPNLSLWPVTDASLSLATLSPGGNDEVGRGDGTPEPDSAAQFSLPSTSSPRSSDAMETPLGPRWGDYSFREVDLAYGRPPEMNSDTVPTEEERRLHKRHLSSRSLFSLIRERPGPKQKEFEVDRRRYRSR
ncbi:hypothetical protein GGR58DRAFT_481142 [Xylaria digitata]|nr:hypothetical protein GGR58DRAFT_481142 [Xylaria digitata]